MIVKEKRSEYAFQIHGRDFWLEHKKVYFAIDMGLGKTGICINTIRKINLPTLVVAPLKVAYKTWPDEVEKWGFENSLSVDVLHDKQKDLLFERRAQIQVINYEGIPWLYKKLFSMFKAKIKIPYKVLVLDESTFIKDHTSKRFGYLCAMRGLFEYIALLSGTPSPNSLLDLWAQYFILDGGETLGSDYRVFRDQYFEQDPYRKYTWNLRLGAEDAIHRKIAHCTFRLQSSDYIDIPERLYNNIYLELPSKERKMYETFKKDFVLMLDKTKIESLNKASLSSKLRQFVQGAVYENTDTGDRKTHYLHDIKARALVELCEANRGKSILCAVQFRFEIELIRKFFPQVPAIVGETPTSVSNNLIEQWNARKIPLLLAHPKSVSRGLNLQYGGHIMLWYAPTYSLDDYLQFNKRLHRPGQKEKVIIHHFVLRNTIDELVYNVLASKDATQHKLLECLRRETNKWLKTR